MQLPTPAKSWTLQLKSAQPTSRCLQALIQILVMPSQQKADEHSLHHYHYLHHLTGNVCLSSCLQALCILSLSNCQMIAGLKSLYRALDRRYPCACLTPTSALFGLILRCCLQVLKALAQLHSPEIATKLHQLRIMAFLVRELSLEFDVQQYAHLSPGMAANAATRLTSTLSDMPDTPQLTTPHGRPVVPRRSLHGKYFPDVISLVFLSSCLGLQMVYNVVWRVQTNVQLSSHFKCSAPSPHTPGLFWQRAMQTRVYEQLIFSPTFQKKTP